MRLVVVMLLALAAACGRADAAVGPAVGISAPGERVALSDAAIAPDGQAVASWERLGADLTGTGVGAALRSAGGTWSAPSVLDDQDPQTVAAAIAADGTAVVVWSRPDGSIHAGRREPGATGFTPVLVSPTLPGTFNTTNSNRPPALAIDSLGNAIVVWKPQYVPDPELLAAWVPEQGPALPRVPVAPDHEIDDYAVAMRGPGEATVAWSGRPAGAAADDFTTPHAVRTATGRLGLQFAPPAIVSAPGRDTRGGTGPPALAGDGRGGLALAWAQQQEAVMPGGASPFVDMAASTAAPGAPFTPAQRLSGTVFPRVLAGRNADGGSVVAWDGAGAGVLSVHAPPGGRFGAPVVATIAGGGTEVYLTSAAVTSTGASVLAWTRRGPQVGFGSPGRTPSGSLVAQRRAGAPLFCAPEMLGPPFGGEGRALTDANAGGVGVVSTDGPIAAAPLELTRCAILTAPAGATTPAARPNPRAVSPVGSRITIRGRHARVRVRCQIATTCRGRAQLRAPRRRGRAGASYGSRRFRVAGTRRATVNVPLSRRARSALRGRREIRAALHLRVDGSRKTVSRRVRLLR